MDTGFGPTQLYSACRLTITHYYQPNDHTWEPCFGTGFLVQFPQGDNRFGLVTNRHLTDVPWRTQYKDVVVKSVKIEMWQGRTLRLEFTINDPQPLYHDDPTIDVAVIPFGPSIDTEIIGTPYDKIKNIDVDPIEGLMMNHGLSWPYLLECEELWPLLEPGEFVSFPGYPAWYDKLQTRPVLRSGMIASDPQTEYRRLEGDPTIKDGNRQVLFDAFSTSGNSGSPVFVAQRGLAPLPIHLTSSEGKFSPDGPAARLEVTGYHRSFLIGINAGHINDLDNGRDNDHAGLSRLHKLSVIMDILRANTSPSSGANTVRIFIPKELVDALNADAASAEAVESPRTD
ncbi:hypothetical protein BN973_03918 [Mycobacterium numidiamassiliense]|uniref:Trypsin-like peptidase domain-containing protein n=1 Tax=Mycobacterium numidiamassiliense TaxID=1841861 RepID=A0A2U3PDY8_9MYCO|nr:hypothetical protein [Mycobacterium numidiamassiliense]SPM41930.1 hypothetical protein BN973_03918 [Mycobacterium numidiamassiliense]